MGPRSMAMGDASLALRGPWSVSNSPGALGKQRDISAAIAYESRYFIPGLGVSALNMSAPVGSGVVGLSAARIGINGYNHNQIGLAYGIALNEQISIGTKLNYHHLRIGGGYGSLSNVTADIGLLVMPLSSLQLAAHVVNPWRARLADFDDEQLSSALRVAAAYQFSEKVLAVLEAEKDIWLPLNLKFGVEYEPIEALHIRMGAASAQRTFTFGIGYQKRQFGADIAAEWSQLLGYSSCIALSYQLLKKQS